MLCLSRSCSIVCISYSQYHALSIKIMSHCLYIMFSVSCFLNQDPVPLSVYHVLGIMLCSSRPCSIVCASRSRYYAFFHQDPVTLCLQTDLCTPLSVSRSRTLVSVSLSLHHGVCIMVSKPLSLFHGLCLVVSIYRGLSFMVSVL